MKKLFICLSLLFWRVPAFAYGHIRHFSEADKRFFGFGGAIFFGLLILIAILDRTGKRGDMSPVYRQLGLKKGTEKALRSLSADDPSVAPELIKRTASAAFMKLYECQSSGDFSPMARLMTPELYAACSANPAALHKGRNILREDINRVGVDLVHFNYTEYPGDRTVTALIALSGREEFQELWTFRHSGDAWLLSLIETPAESTAPASDDFSWRSAGA